MKLTWILAALISWLAPAALAQAQAKTSVADVYNAFMDHYADGNPAWKKNVAFGGDLSKPPEPPLHLNYSDSLGYYTYETKRWDELTAYEQFALQNDPRLSHFIRQFYGTEAEHPAHMIKLAQAPDSRSAKPTPLFTAVPAPTPAPAPAAPSPRTEEMNVGTRGLLHVEPGMCTYKFDPEELTSAKPVRLMEVGQP